MNVPHPVLVRCIRYEDIPAAPSRQPIADTADPEQRAAWAKLRDEQLRVYIKALRAALIACSTGDSTP